MTDTIWPMLAAGSSPDQTVLLGVAMIALCLLALGLMRRKAARAPNARDYTREAASRIREQQGVKQDMETLMVQLSELARQLNGQMDTRYAKLEQVMAEADQKIVTLEALLRKTNGGQSLDVVVGEEDVPAGAEKPAVPTPPSGNRGSKSRKPNKQGKKSEELTKPGKAEKAAGKASASSPQVMPAAPVVSTPAVASVVPAAPSGPVGQAQPGKPSESVDPRYGRIYSLADKGQSPIEIARQTGQTTGEIELILNLRRSQVH